MKIKEIDGCEIYRDGGSFGLMYTGEDGKYYELFLQIRFNEKNPDKAYKDPVVYFEDCNSGKIVLNLSWKEAQKFIDGWSYDEPSINNRFSEFREIIKNEGNHIIV